MKAFHVLVSCLKPVCSDPAEAASQAWLLLEQVTGKSRSWLLAHPDYTFLPEQQYQLEHLVNQRVHDRIPLQYLLGSVPFMNLTLTVRPPTLIPRLETEEWVAWLIEQLSPVKNQPLKILDVCTGSGCIALALAQALPHATVTGSDISEQAIALATENARNNRITNTTFLVADLFEGVHGRVFDLIVSNPPYITQTELEHLEPEVKAWEDERALLGGSDGLALYRRLAEQVARFVNPKSLLIKNGLPIVVFEVGTDAGSVKTMLLDGGIAQVAIRSDLQGVARWVVGVGLTGRVD